MANSADELEARITELRSAVRRAASSGDRATARQLRAELRRAESLWDEIVLGDQDTEPIPVQLDSSGVTVRDHVHRALTLLSVPSAPKLVAAVHEGFFSGTLISARLTSLRRDEERSFRAAPYARPYYICAALTSDLLAPARGLLAVSSWPAPRRVIGPLSPRVDLLTSVIRLAEHQAAQPGPPRGERVLWRLATSIPDAVGRAGTIDTGTVIAAARAELAVHTEDDAAQRVQAAQRVAKQLGDPAAQLFGIRLRAADRQEYEAR